MRHQVRHQVLQAEPDIRWQASGEHAERGEVSAHGAAAIAQHAPELGQLCWQEEHGVERSPPLLLYQRISQASAAPLRAAPSRAPFYAGQVPLAGFCPCCCFLFPYARLLAALQLPSGLEQAAAPGTTSSTFCP